MPEAKSPLARFWVTLLKQAESAITVKNCF